MNNIHVEIIDGKPIAIAVSDGTIVARSLEDFSAPTTKTGFFGFSNLEDFMMFVADQGTLGTSLWILPEPQNGIVLSAVIDGHTHYHPGRLAYRANYFADTFSKIDEKLIRDFCREHQYPIYRGTPADPVVNADHEELADGALNATSHLEEKAYGPEEAADAALRTQDSIKRREEERKRLLRLEADTNWACSMSDVL